MREIMMWDLVVPKLDVWEKIRTAYFNSHPKSLKELPKDPPVFIVKDMAKNIPNYNGNCCDCYCLLIDQMNQKPILDLTIKFSEEDLLKAP